MVVATTIFGENVCVYSKWLSKDELAAWVRLVAVIELLPGVLDSQLRRAADLTNFEYYVLAMLSEAPDRTARMTALAAQTSATLPRLSHVVKRLEARNLVDRFPCPEDGRATNARLTESGWDKVLQTAPGHVANVRQHVIDASPPNSSGSCEGSPMRSWSNSTPTRRRRPCTAVTTRLPETLPESSAHCKNSSRSTPPTPSADRTSAPRPSNSPSSQPARIHLDHAFGRPGGVAIGLR